MATEFEKYLAERLKNPEVRAGYEAENQLTSTCTTCEQGITFYEYTQWNGQDYDRLDGWWSHWDHPTDGHTAEPQPTDATLALKAER